MHPSELKNQALVAAALAKHEGFTATAEALVLLAKACAAEARYLRSPPIGSTGQRKPETALDRFSLLEVFR